jgi:NCK-associated protein 1
LIEASEGLFARLHRSDTTLANARTRPQFLDDKGFAKVSDAFQKAFPRLPNDPARVVGYAEFVQNNAQGVHDQLAASYYAFVDTAQWQLAAKEVIIEVGKGTTSLKYDSNPSLTEAFLDVVQIYMRLLFMLQRISDRQVIMGVFNRAYFHLKYVGEPSYDKTAEFVAMYSEIIPRVQADFRPVSGQIVEAIMSLYMPFIQNVDVDSLRTKGVHSLTLNPETMGLPSDDRQLWDILAQSRNYMRIVYGLLPCGESFGKVSPDMIGAVLQESVLAPLYREFSLDILNRYQYMIKTFKPKKSDVPAELLKELTKIMAAVKKSVDGAEKYMEKEIMFAHYQRRVYLRLELGNLFALLKDKPGLLGPKMTLVMSCLAMARDEIMWLVRHQTGPLPKSSKFKPEDFDDKRLTDIVYLVNQFVSLIRRNAGSIKKYYQEALKGVDARVAQKELAGVTLPPGSKVKGLIDGIVAEVQAIQVGQEQDFAGLRLNWFRAEAWLSSSESSAFVDPIKVMLAKFITICKHSEYVDSLEVVLDRHVTLGDFWYSRECFKQLFVNAIAGGPTQPMRCMVYLRLLAEFAVRPNPYCLEEHVNRGKACVILAKHFLERIALCINNGLVVTANQFAKFEDQVNEMNAAYHVLKNHPSFKPAKDFVPPAAPGSESVFYRRKELEALRQTEATTFQLCSALNEDMSIKIFNTVFTPREFVRERLMLTLKEFLFKNVMVGNGAIERPSVLERRINNFCSVFILVENYLDINVSAVFRETFLSQVHHGSLSDMGSPLGAVPNPNEWSDCMVKPLVSWYVSFVTQHLLSGDKAGVVWSPNRKSFVSRTGNAFRAEEYVNIHELSALCRLIGPYGVKLIDGEVLKIVVVLARKLKEVLLENRAACLELQKLFVEKDSDCLQAFKSFKNLDVVVTLLTNIGLVLNFRELIHESLGVVMKELVPILRDAVESAFNQYKPNTFMVDEYVACDILAMECGLKVGTADQVLKFALRDVFGTSSEDVVLWALLPTLAAASFLSKSWAEADYRTTIEAYRTNLHCMTKSLTQLIVAFKALTSQTRNELEIQLLLEVFLDHSTVLLLRASQCDPRLLTKLTGIQMNNWGECLIFLDLFLEEAGLERESLQGVLPYALLRSFYKQVYTTKDALVQGTMRQKKKENVDGI